MLSTMLCRKFATLALKGLMKGLRKAEPCPTQKRQPLTSDLLARCITTLRMGYLSTHIGKEWVLESMFKLAFYGFLRCSEFTAASLNYHPTRHVSIHSETLIFYLKHSKTNQSDQPQPIYLFHLDSYLSPCKLLQHTSHTFITT